MALEIMQITGFLVAETALSADGASERMTWKRGNPPVCLRSRRVFVLRLGQAVLEIMDVARSFGGEGWVLWTMGTLKGVVIWSFEVGDPSGYLRLKRVCVLQLWKAVLEKMMDVARSLSGEGWVLWAEGTLEGVVVIWICEVGDPCGVCHCGDGRVGWLDGRFGKFAMMF